MSITDEQPPLPEGAVESHRVTVRSYIDRDGAHQYVVHTNGEAPASSFLGLLVMAQRDILDW